MATITLPEMVSQAKVESVDNSSVNAIRGLKNGKEYLFVSWDRWADKRLYRRRMSRGKVEAKKELKKDYELYDIISDPFQLNNQLFYNKEKFKLVSEELKEEMQKLKKCSGKTCH